MRLLALVETEELTVAELAAATQLAQPRVSTHLAKLREAQLVQDRRSGVSVYYRLDESGFGEARLSLWRDLSRGAEDALLDDDRQRLPGVLAARAQARNWADSVAGDMERHYSPGRTWEATARALTGLVSAGDVLDLASGDGVLAALLAPRVRSITCIDSSARVVDACKARLAAFSNATVQQADMHELPFPEASFDRVTMLHALTYTTRPKEVFVEAARVLKRDGELLGVTLKKHRHESAVAPFGHANLGFRVADLKRYLKQAGLAVSRCEVASTERRPPHFEVVIFQGARRS